jgi:hypothetical protein
LDTPTLGSKGCLNVTRASEYSHYTVHVCSHMRLVVFSDGSKGPGWYHVSHTGMLESLAPPCEACIHRTRIEWPENTTRLDHMLMGDRDEDRPKYLQYLPSDKALYERVDNPEKTG